MSRPRVVAMDCGASRLVVAAFTARPDGSLLLEDVALQAYGTPVGGGTPWVAEAGRFLEAPGAVRRWAGPFLVAPPSHDTLLKFIRAPQVEASKRGKVIQFEAQQNIPYPLAEVVWSSEPVHEDGVEFEVALAAAKLDLMEELCGTLGEAGIQPARIEPSALALHRAFRHTYPDVGAAILLLDIGARMTELLYAAPGRFFVRSLAIGGNTLTQLLADELKLDLLAAEELKQRALAEPPPPGSREAAGLASAVSAFAAKLALEVTRSLVGYRRQSGVEAPESVYLTGGGSQVANLDSVLHEKLRMPVGWFEPFRRVELSAAARAAGAESLGYRLAGVIGLAAGGLDEGSVRADLLPPRVRAAAEFRRRQPRLLVAAALVVGALLLPTVHFQNEARAAAARTEALERQAAPLREFNARNQRQMERIDAAAREIEAIRALVETRSNWINFFSDLQGRLGEVGDVWLDRLQVVRASGDASPSAGGLFGSAPAAASAAPLRLFVSGRLVDRKNPVSKVSQESTERVRSLSRSFRDSPFILDVENERFDTTQPGVLRFEFTMVIDPSRPL